MTPHLHLETKTSPTGQGSRTLKSILSPHLSLKGGRCSTTVFTSPAPEGDWKCLLCRSSPAVWPDDISRYFIKYSKKLYTV